MASGTAIPGTEYWPNSGQVVWSDPFIEPKQQHRFLCSFPVYMPVAGSGVYDTRDLRDILQPPLVISAGSEEATLEGFRRARDRAALSRQKKNQAKKSGAGGATERPRPTRPPGAVHNTIRTEAQRIDLIHKYVSVLGQSYIVSAFDPPQYGTSMPMAAVPGSKVMAPVAREASAKLNEATLTLVSTVRDDLHFSMNLLFQLANKTGQGSVDCALYPDVLWGQQVPREKRILTVLDMGARPDPTETITPTMGVAQFFDATPVGIHKIYDPIVTSIQFTEYSYAGEAFLTTTVTLAPRVASFAGYTYEAFVSNNTGLLTRRGARGPDKYSVNSSEDFGYQLPKLLADAYARYPNFFVKEGSLGADETGQQKPFPTSTADKIQKSITDRTNQRLNLRDVKVDSVMARAVGKDPAKRRGMLEPLLKTKAEQVAEQEAQAAKAAEAAAARQTAEEKAILDEQREGDHAQRIADLQTRGGETTGGEATTLDEEPSAGENPIHDEAREYATEPPPDPANVTQTTPEEHASGIPEEIDWGGTGSGLPDAIEEPPVESPESYASSNPPADNDLAPLQTGAGQPDQTPTEQHFPHAPRPGDPVHVPETWEEQQQRVEESYSGAPSPEVPDSGPGSPFGGSNDNVQGPDPIVPGTNGMTQSQVDAAYASTDALLEQQPGQGSGGSLADQATQESLGGQLGGDNQYQSGNGASNNNSVPAGTTPGESDPPGMGSNPNCIGNSCVPPSHSDPETGERVVNEDGLRWSHARGYYDPNA